MNDPADKASEYATTVHASDSSESDDNPESSDVLFETTAAVKPKKTSRGRKKTPCDSDTSEGGSERSFASVGAASDVPDRNQVLCHKLASEQRASRKLRTELTSKNLLLQRWHDLFENFKEVGTKIIQDEAGNKHHLL